MKKVLFDINVVLDVLLDRKPHAEASAAVWAAVEADIAEGLLAAHAVTTIHYLVRKEMGATKTKRIMASILKVFGVAAVDGAVIQEALTLPCSDFQDAVTAAAAQIAGCEYIVTRDPKGFHGSPVRSLAPEAILPILDGG
ncbi:MAG TPA: PIN domain-containing protein [Bryobacteraceae bacterium]|jgi:predicted nucleic acid-binding protein|nr:PIN domain-containing protein [Bryobacteraceae bacterium]